MNNVYNKKGDHIKSKFNKKGQYIYPVIIDDSTGGIYYTIKFALEFDDFKINKIYFADYKLIKRCHIDVWNYIFNKYKNN